METGLFTRVEATQVRNASKSLALPVERLWELGEKGVRTMNESAKTPHMDPSGSDRPDVYILGDMPGAEADRSGEPFAGSAARLLLRYIPRDVALRFNNCCRTRTPGDRPPTPTELECYRPSVQQDIERTRPKVIVGLGPVALSWVLGNQKIKVCRGRHFPVRIGRHTCWFFPTLHPAYVLKVKDSRERDDDVPGPEWARAFEWDIRGVFAARKRLPKPFVVDETADLWEDTKLYAGGDPSPVLKALARMSKLPRAALDFETNRLRPYSAGAKILSVAVGRYDNSIAFAWDHPQAGWSSGAKRQIQAAFRQFVFSPAAKCAHNLPFELEWLEWLYGPDVLRCSPWHCTLQQAYILDERKGGLSLNYLSLLHFGLNLKSLSKTTAVEKWFGMDLGVEHTIDRSQLERTNIQDVLSYNVLDAKYDDLLYEYQKDALKEAKLHHVYRTHIERVPSVVDAQHIGVPVNRTALKEFGVEFDTKVQDVQKAMKQDKAVVQYESRYGEFNPDGRDDQLRMFRDLLQRKEGRRGKGYSTDKEALAAMSDLPLAKLMLAYREVTKLQSTYVQPYDSKSNNSNVYPDGRLHTSFNTALTSTGRLSSEGPNLQNFPKRKNKQLRRIVGPPAGHLMIAMDYGQLEARVIAMASRDKTLVQSMWDGTDIHQDWAERIVKRYDKTFKARGSDMKKFRNEVKNQMVFPAFFGSSEHSISGNLEMPDRIMSPLFEQFWEEFKGVKLWQGGINTYYEKHFAVACLTDRLRRGPLSWNERINAPIQGTASDLVIAAMNRLSVRAYKTGKPWLAPVMNIHDDLSFFVPRAKVDSSLEIIAREMCAVVFDFINVPVVVEASVGENWFDMEEVGKFSSEDYGHERTL